MKGILVLLIVLLSGEFSMAQRNKLEIPRRTVLGIQEFATPDPVFQTDLVEPTDLLFIQVNLTNQTRTNPNTRFKLSFFTSLNDGETWIYIANMTFIGDPDLPNTTPIGIGLSANTVINKRVKVQVDTATQISIGASVLIGSATELGF